MGNLAVPLALIVLGASFARCHVPRPLSRLPISAMLACAAAKMLVLPLVGVCAVQAMVRHGWIGRDAKVEQFVAMLLSGTPAAVKYVPLLTSASMILIPLCLVSSLSPVSTPRTVMLIFKR